MPTEPAAPMTDDEFLALCGFRPTDFQDAYHRARVLAALARMGELFIALNLRSAGLGPLPPGVTID